MLKSLLIKNYRLFDTFRLPRLSSVNLFVGKNNTGKSALLEAIQIWGTNASFDVIHEIVKTRDGYWEFEVGHARESKDVLENPLGSLFREYRFPPVGEDGIEIGPLDAARLKVKLSAYQIVLEEQAYVRVPISPSMLNRANLVNVEYSLEAEEGGAKWQLAPLVTDIRVVGKVLPSGREPKCMVQSVPPRNMHHERLSQLWDKVHLTDLEHSVSEFLRLVTHNLIGIAFVGDPSRTDRKRIPIVRLKDSAERLPLKSLGDGMTRLLEIALALVNAKDGILLIDEFENGLHWSVQPQVWRLVFAAAQELGVGVFATTHSQDCVRAFQSVWKLNEDFGSFYRVDRNGKTGPYATAYDCETLGDALQTEVEVR